MSCCRSPQPQVRHKTRILAVCVSCRASIREQISAALKEASLRRPGRGTHRVTAEVTCACGAVNRVALSWVKR